MLTVENRDHGATGYWGTPDALHQFCEPHYATSHYFAEFYNAISSLVYTSVAFYALASCQPMRSDPVVAASWIWLAIIGLGSFAFHATMRYELELTDEIPMVGYIGTSLLGKVSTPGVHPYVKTTEQSFVWSIFVTSLCVATVTAYLVLDSYTLFVNAFTVLALLDTYLGFTFHKGQEVKRWCLRTATVLIVLAKTVWEIENRLCGTYPAVWPLHVVWHVLSCAAVYYGIVACFVNRVERGLVGKGDAISLRWAVFLPFDEILLPPN